MTGVPSNVVVDPFWMKIIIEVKVSTVEIMANSSGVSFFLLQI
jgi:hypothetical protein